MSILRNNWKGDHILYMHMIIHKYIKYNNMEYMYTYISQMLEAPAWGGIPAHSPVWERHKRSSWDTRLAKTACGLVGRKMCGQNCLQPWRQRQGIWIWCGFSIKYIEIFYNYLASTSRLFYPLLSSRLLSLSIFCVLYLEKVRARDWYKGGGTGMGS